MLNVYQSFEDSRKINRQRGFTLIELLVVVAIIAILAAIAIPQFGKYRVNAAKRACESDLRNAINMCAAALADDPSKSSCTSGTDYPSSTTNASSISLTVNSDGSISGTANCKGAYTGTCSASSSAGSISISCSS